MGVGCGPGGLDLGGGTESERFALLPSHQSGPESSFWGAGSRFVRGTGLPLLCLWRLRGLTLSGGVIRLHPLISSYPVSPAGPILTVLGLPRSGRGRVPPLAWSVR